MTAVLDNSPAAWSDRANIPAPWEACGWSQESQQARFQAVLAALQPRPGESLMDYGSGLGGLTEHLPEGVDYVGFDWAPGMVARAQADHPGYRFQLWEPSGLFDLVAAVGPFNLGDKQLTWPTLRRLWDATRRRLAVSLYAGDDDRCVRYSEEEVRRFGRGESYYTTTTRWRENDILLVLSRESLS